MTMQTGRARQLTRLGIAHHSGTTPPRSKCGFTNALGKIATSVYDTAGRLNATIDALGGRTSYSFDAAGRQIRTQNALGKITTSVLDSVGRTVATVNPLGNRTSFVHDAIGRQIRIVNPLGKINTSLYDDANRLRATIDPTGNRTTLGHDTADQRVTVRDAANNVTTSVFDATGTMVATINALGGRTTQVFDSAGRRKALVDAKGNRTTFGFDDAGRNVLILDAVGNRTTWGYDAAGQQRFRIDGRGNRTTYVHDDAGQLTGRRYPDGSRATFAFDALGQRTKMHDSTGRTTYTFDDLQRLRTVVNPANKKLTYAYDAIGQRRFLIEPEGGRFTTAYDDAGRIRFLVNPQGYRTSWTHDAADRVKVQYLGNSTRASYSYDDANRLLKLANIRTDATTISSFDYAYDSVGNRTRVVEFDGIRVTWSYDAKYQLTRERRSGANAYDITYSYDLAGNRRVKLEDSVRTTYAYDAANQLRYHEDNTGRTTYTFDANGNQRIVMTPSGSLTTNTWDYEDKLTKVILASGTRNTFAYDADGKRVKKEDSTGTSKFVWDAENILIETNATEIIQVVYSLDPVTYGNLISQYRSAATSFFHFDVLGSTDRLTNGSGTVTDSYAYKAFGSHVVVSGATTNPFRFVGSSGYYFDSDLVHVFVRVRPLTPSLGRWISRDPQGFGDGPNLYLYVLNNSLVAIDPSGLKICKLPPDALLNLMKEFLGIAGWADKDGRISLASVACVACQESDYDPCAISKADAIGYMHITAIAWKQCLADSKKSGLPQDGTFTPRDKACCKKENNPPPKCDPCEKNAWNWRNNVRCGIYMLKYCRDKVSRPVTLEEILRCYNSGRYDANNPETNNYVKQIMECIEDMKKKLAEKDKPKEEPKKDKPKGDVKK